MIKNTEFMLCQFSGNYTIFYPLSDVTKCSHDTPATNEVFEIKPFMVDFKVEF